MENKVIEILDYIGEKLGIAVDWTAENVMPQVTEFLSRYQIYSIVNDAIWIVINLIGVILGIHFFKNVTNAYNNEESDVHCDEFFAGMGWAATGFMIALCVTFALVNIFDIVGWSIVPEMKFLEVFSEYLNNAN